jgi:hypothetical protein
MLNSSRAGRLLALLFALMKHVMERRGLYVERIVVCNNSGNQIYASNVEHSKRKFSLIHVTHKYMEQKLHAKVDM